MAYEVNRYLADKAMDHIDHALGRPADPLGETYRSHFATSGALADEMAASPHWEEGRPNGSMRFFFVTRDGRIALRDHLQAIGDRHRAFLVTFEGHQARVAATSRSKARYRYWREVADCLPDLSFGTFCALTSVRLA